MILVQKHSESGEDLFFFERTLAFGSKRHSKSGEDFFCFFLDKVWFRGKKQSYFSEGPYLAFQTLAHSVLPPPVLK